MESIIVYRNPIEAALWQGLTSAEFVPVLFGVVAFFVAFLATNSLAVKLYRRYVSKTWWYSPVPTRAALAFATACGIAVTYSTWI